jgi:hypothetical protein
MDDQTTRLLAAADRRRDAANTADADAVKLATDRDRDRAIVLALNAISERMAERNIYLRIVAEGFARRG